MMLISLSIEESYSLLVRCLLCPIWRPVLALNITYIFIFLSQLSSANLPSKDFLHFTYKMSCLSFLRLGRSSRVFVQVRDSFWRFVRSLFFFTVSCYPNPQLTSWRITTCRVSTTAYSIYSQLPLIVGGRLLRRQPEDAPCCAERLPDAN